MIITEYESRDAAAAGLAKTVIAELKSGIQQRGFASLAVPGGSTPGPFLQAMGELAFNWPCVRLTATDERLVPEDHERSNTRLIKETLLQGIDSPPQFLAINDARRIDELSAQLREKFLPLDVCVLGMGDDGHTASLFPGCDGQLLDASQTDVLAAVTPPGDLEDRLSLTMQVLAHASHLHVLIHGENKKEVLAEARAGDDENHMPIRALFRQAGDKLVIHYAP